MINERSMCHHRAAKRRDSRAREAGEFLKSGKKKSFWLPCCLYNFGTHDSEVRWFRAGLTHFSLLVQYNNYGTSCRTVQFFGSL
jgi:hypothetical protein